MMLFRSMRRAAAIAAMLAITLQALWPLLSHARPKDPSLLVPVCTVDGITHYLEIKSGRTTPLDERSASHGEHCKLCVFGGDRDVAVLPANVPVLIAQASQSEVSHSAKQCTVPLYLFASRPRAPPAIA